MSADECDVYVVEGWGLRGGGCELQHTCFIGDRSSTTTLQMRGVGMPADQRAVVNKVLAGNCAVGDGI